MADLDLQLEISGVVSTAIDARLDTIESQIMAIESRSDDLFSGAAANANELGTEVTGVTSGLRRTDRAAAGVTDELEDAADAVSDMADGLDDVDNSLQDADRGAQTVGSSADDAGDSFNGWGSVIDDATSKLGRTRLATLGVAAGAGAASVALASWSSDQVAEATARVRELDHAAAQTGQSLEDLQRIEFVLNTAGIEDGLDAYVELTREFGNRIGEAVEEQSGAAFDRLTGLGIDIPALQLQFESDAPEAIATIQEAIESLPQSQQIFAAEEIFGGQGSEILLTLSHMNADLRNLPQDINIIDPQEAEALREAGIAAGTLGAELDGLQTEIGSQLADEFTGLTNAIAPAVGAVSDWLDRTDSADDIVGALTIGLGALAVVIGVALTPAIIGFVAATLPISGTVLAVAAGVAVLTGGLYFLERRFGLVSAAIDAVTNPLDTLQAAWDWFKDAPAPIKVLTSVLALPLAPIVATGAAVLAVKNNFDELRDGAIDVADDVTGVYLGMVDFVLAGVEKLGNAVNRLPGVDIDTSGLTDLREELADVRETGLVTTVLQPATPEPQPATSELQPATQEPQPIAQELQPATQELQPATQELQPTAQEPQPIVQELQPATQELQPATQEPQPATQEPQPTAQELQPAAQELQPATQEPQPVILEPRTAVPESRPVGPVSYTIAPVFNITAAPDEDVEALARRIAAINTRELQLVMARQ